MKAKLLKKNSGFTLYELLVVMSIILIMTGLVYFNYKVSQDQLALQRSAYRLTSDLRRTEAMAGLSASVCGPNFKYSYGIYFKTADANKYIIFADCDDNGYYQQATDVKVGEYDFEKNVRIKELKMNAGGGVEADIAIVFKPPDPTVTIQKNPGGGVSGDLGTVVLELATDPTRTRTITVNKAGLVDLTQ